MRQRPERVRDQGNRSWATLRKNRRAPEQKSGQRCGKLWGNPVEIVERNKSSAVVKGSNINDITTNARKARLASRRFREHFLCFACMSGRAPQMKINCSETLLLIRLMAANCSTHWPSAGGFWLVSSRPSIDLNVIR